MLSIFIILVVTSCIFFSAAEEQLQFTLPKNFGNFTLAELGSAPACGTTMATYNSIPAKSNGQYQGTGTSCSSYGTYGYQYQCVELTQRYFATKYGTTPIWYANAKDMCSNHPSSVSKTTTPKAGDAVVFGWGTYGHTAIITSVGSSTVSVIEQNASPTGVNTYSKSDVYCYLTSGSSPSSGSCSHVGYYCGNDGLGKDPNTLYYCSGTGATPTVKTSCSFTCVTMPSGQDDTCSTSGTCSTVNTGYYCGSDKVNGNANTLYYCKSSQPYGAKYCSNGCYTASSGSDDYCK